MSTLPLQGFNFPFKETHATQAYSYQGNTHHLVREYLVAWDLRFAFCQALLGRAQILRHETTGPYLKRYDPHAAVGFESTATGNNVLFATEIESISGVGPNPESPTGTPLTQRVDDLGPFKQARVRVVYEAPTFSVLPDDPKVETQLFTESTGGVPPPAGGEITATGAPETQRYITKIVQPTLEVFRFPYGYYKWHNGLIHKGKTVADPGKAQSTGAFFVRATAEITYIWHRVPSLKAYRGWPYTDTGKTNSEYVGAYSTHPGSLNSGEFDGYPAGTLLLKAVEAHPYRWIDGLRYYDYTYRCALFWGSNTHLSADTEVTNITDVGAIGHNFFLRQEPGTTTGNAGETLYAEPFYSLLTHDGTKAGQRVYREKNFKHLFTPYCLEHMAEYYGLYRNV